jgi:type I restriction enzyme S subunit
MSENKGLPNGWAKVSLADVGTLYCGQSPQTAEVNQVGRGMPYFTGPEQWDGHQLLVTKWTTDPRRVVPDGCVFITVKGAGVGTLFPGMAGAIGRDVYAYEPSQSLSVKFIEHSLRHNIDQVLQHAKGDIPGLSKNHILNQIIAFPPRNEQDRIVAEIETQFTRLDAAVVALQRVQANLKRYRASVLQTACTGRLVPTEAELARAEGRVYESAEQLLQRILRERRAQWESEQLANMQAEGKIPKDDRWKIKYRESAKPDTSELPELPTGWVWASPEQLVSSDDYSLAIGPFGSNLKVSDYTDEGVPLIFVRNIRSQTFGGDSTNYISQEKAEELRAHWISPGDILVTKMGDPPGDACLYPYGQPKAVITADCIKLHLHYILNSSMYFVYTINSHMVRQQMLAITKGVAQLKVSLARFRNIGFPLPPLAEQHRIVAEVERRLSVIGELEGIIATNLKRVDRLHQAILKRAFDGKLVQQDPNDEPASVLLERIREERARSLSEEQTSQHSKARRMPRERREKSDSEQTEKRRSLFEVLSQVTGHLTPKQLFDQAGYTPESIDDFYEELHQEIKTQRITQERPNNIDIYLKAADK